MIALGGEVTRAGAHSRHHAAGTLDLAKQEVRHAQDKWTPLIGRTVATRDEGTADLVEKLERHKAWLFGTEDGERRRNTCLAEAMRTQLREALIDAAVGALGPSLDAAVQAVARREVDPYTASERLIAEYRARA